MKTKFVFEIMQLDDESVAVPVGTNAEKFHGVLKVNETAAAILKLMENEITEEEIVKKLMREYYGEKDMIATYVHEYIDKLASEGLVE